MTLKIKDIQQVDANHAKPKVVYDLKMPRFEYRNDRGEAVSRDIVQGKDEAKKLNFLSNIKIN